MDWKFWIGDIGIPLVTFIIGLFTGKSIEKHKKANTKITGDKNIVIQNSDINSK